MLLSQGGWAGDKASAHPGTWDRAGLIWGKGGAPGGGSSSNDSRYHCCHSFGRAPGSMYPRICVRQGGAGAVPSRARARQSVQEAVPLGAGGYKEATANFGGCRPPHSPLPMMSLPRPARLWLCQEQAPDLHGVDWSWGSSQRSLGQAQRCRWEGATGWAEATLKFTITPAHNPIKEFEVRRISVDLG